MFLDGVRMMYRWAQMGRWMDGWMSGWTDRQNINFFHVTNLSINSNGSAEAFTVSTLITWTCVKNASIMVWLRINVTMTRLKCWRDYHIAFFLGPSFTQAIDTTWNKRNIETTSIRGSACQFCVVCAVEYCLIGTWFTSNLDLAAMMLQSQNFTGFYNVNFLWFDSQSRFTVATF